jgi:hypothetical protein
MKATLRYLELLTIEQIITARILRFLGKSRPYAGEWACSRGLAFTSLNRGQSKRGAQDMATRQLYVHALEAGGLLDSNDGAFSKWMHRFGEDDIGSLEPTQWSMKEKAQQHKDLKPPTTTTTTPNCHYTSSLE